jgi:hypothetical protein
MNEQSGLNSSHVAWNKIFVTRSSAAQHRQVGKLDSHLEVNEEQDIFRRSFALRLPSTHPLFTWAPHVKANFMHMGRHGCEMRAFAQSDLGNPLHIRMLNRSVHRLKSSLRDGLYCLLFAENLGFLSEDWRKQGIPDPHAPRVLDTPHQKMDSSAQGSSQ